MRLFRGRRVLLPGEASPVAACVLVDGEGIITQVTRGYDPPGEVQATQVVDAGDLVLMPGVIDVHVHLNEPGRTEWEGFETGTKACAAGGVTSMVEMPLNSMPPTTSVEALELKVNTVQHKLWVDTGFWGGVVGVGDQSELRPMLKKGVCGFKCFMIGCGTDDFVWAQEEHIRQALTQLQGTNRVLMFHAELELPDVIPNIEGADPRKHSTFLATRPDVMEVEAIKLVCKLCLEYRVPCHIVHLSSAEGLPIIQEYKAKGAPITVETTHHYLFFNSEEVPDGATMYKCCPPIRGKQNQAKLWSGIASGALDMVVSDHSPCTPDLKLLEQGDFLKAWGGISSVQFGLSLLWTSSQAHHPLSLQDMVRLLHTNPARLSGLDSQGKGRGITPGAHADMVVWDPDATFVVTEDIIQHKHKPTPYLGKTLRGVVHKTIVRGNIVYQDGKVSPQPLGKTLLA